MHCAPIYFRHAADRASTHFSEFIFSFLFHVNLIHRISVCRLPTTTNYYVQQININMNSSKKRKRKKAIKVPRDIVQNESLELVASVLGPIKTLPVTLVDKDILLDRIRIELLDKYNFFLKTSTPQTAVAARELDDLNIEEKRSIYLRRHLIVGTNECTRALEKAIEGRVLDGNNKKKLVPSLVMLARDLRPPTIMAHFPYLCKQLNIPIVLLPGKASSEVGQVFNRKRASVVVFMKYDEDFNGGNKSENEICDGVNSYVKFANSKIPSYLKKS